ncbi:DUF2510 domain-containing protein [Microbacterium sp. LMI1x-1-1.1]|uniref:DUF2510 domain-containing protein n=1 Tax=Microbacterium sp. LMI1x-1-1.1 TaxID=3135246 RepID=UPI00344945F3
MSETTPAGWYPAPHAGNELRYWDGSAWHAAPAYLPASPAPGAPVPPPAVPPYANSAPGTPPVYSGYPGYSTAPYAPPKQQGLAIAALSIGIAAMIFAWIPFFGLLVAMTGSVFGIMALVRRQPKGLSVTGTVLSGLALVWSALVTFSIAALIWFPATSSSEDDYGTADPLPEASPSAPGIQPYAPESGPGSIGDPLPLPYVSESSIGEEYSADIRIVNDDATNEVLSWNSYNGAAIDGQRYVLVEMTVTGLDPYGVSATFPTYDLALATPDGAVYPNAFVVGDEDTTLLRDAGMIDEGEKVTGLVAYLVPEDATDLLLTDYANYYAF